MAVRIGFDIGGTFTDFVLRRPDGELVSEKRLTSYEDLVGDIAAGLTRLLDRAGVPAAEVEQLIHATTLGSNAVLERKGPRLALLTTRGFGDVITIQRSLRWSMYDMQIEKVPPLVARRHVREVDERCRADGSVLRPLDEDAVRALARELAAEGYEAVAVAYLHSYVAPDHERRTRELLLEEAPELRVTASSDVSLQGREYERTNTAVVNAFLMPVLADYISSLESALPELGIDAQLWIMQSSGGLATAENAAERPVHTIESGPAAGALMAAEHGRLAGRSKVIGFDMGGTTAKAAVIEDGRPATSRYFEIQRTGLRRGSGLPLDIPAIDLVEIGTGGGSIAAATLGILSVGPRSASSYPGPACYGNGGEDPTVTDANLLLGYLNPDYFAGGEMTLDTEAARVAVEGLARELELEPQRAAWGIHEVANLEMERALRQVSIDRGLDPRDYTLVASGGAAPAHACRLARSVGIREVIVPAAAGVGSALGLLEADESIELARTALVGLDGDDAEAGAVRIFAELEADARGLVGESWGGDPVAIRRTVGMRFSGQVSELELALEEGEPVDLGALQERFHQLYERNYGYRERLPVEAVTWFFTLLRQRAPAAVAAAAGAASGEARRRPAYFPETGVVETPVHPRAELGPGRELEGPALIEEENTTTVLLPGARLRVVDHGALLIEVGGGDDAGGA